MSAFNAILVLLLIFLPIYFLPSVLAAARKHRHTAAVVALNLLLGWTGIGWVGALVWSLMDQKRGVA